LSYTSSSSPAVNKHRRSPATSVVNSLWSVAAVCIALGVHSTRWNQIMVQNRDFCIPHLHSTSPLGGFRRNIALPFGIGKVEWCSYPTVKNFEDIFIRFDRVHELDRHTDRQTPHDGIGRACIASCSKN